MQRGGDDLDDDLMIDNLVALSDNEGEMLSDRGFFSDNGEAEASLDEGSEDAADIDRKSIENTALFERKRKRREREKQRKAKKRKIAESVDSFQELITSKSSMELSGFLTSKQAKAFPNATAVELEDKQIPANSIANTTSWTQPRSLDQLVDFIVKMTPMLHKRLSQKSKSSGAPTLLFVVASALRAADVTRVLKSKKLRGDRGGEVAKLFAKHLKFSEQVKYLKQTRVGAAVGTPGRIGKLLCETDALAVSALSHIFLDVTHRDAKDRTLLDIPETRDEVFKMVLGASDVRKMIGEGKVQIVLF